jgi:photosystem II stability/assembly factor-like uncharacterized protein
VIPDDPDLRRALAARSGEPSPDFAGRVRASLPAGPPTTTWMPAVAAMIVIAVCVASIGALVLERRAQSPAGAASGARQASPSPSGKGGDIVYLPTDVQLSVPAADTVWALVAGRLLFVSTDHGDNFKPASLPAGVPASSISFADWARGWLLSAASPQTQCDGQQVMLFATVDGAGTWRRLSPRGIAQAQCKTDISFVDATHGFISAWDDNHPPTIYRTADGGLTWAAATLPNPPGFTGEPAGFELRAGAVRRLGPDLLVVASGMNARQGKANSFVFRSVDGGATWNAVATLPTMSGLALVTESRWLLIGNDGTARETVDAGRTWHAFATDYQDAAGVASVFDFGDANVGFGTVRGTIYRTVDGGRHWSKMETPGVFWPG